MQVLLLGASATSLLLVASVSRSVPSAVYQIGQVLNASHARFQVPGARAGTWQDARRTSVLQAGGDAIAVRLVRTIPLPSSALASDLTAMLTLDTDITVYLTLAGSSDTHVMRLRFDAYGQSLLQEVQRLPAARTLMSFEAAGTHYMLVSRTHDALLMRWNGTRFHLHISPTTSAADVASGQMLAGVSASAVHFAAGGTRYSVYLLCWYKSTNTDVLRAGLAISSQAAQRRARWYCRGAWRECLA